MDAGSIPAASTLPSNRLLLGGTRKGFTRISAKCQATIPVQALREAGLAPGDEVRVVAAGRGRLVIERDANVVARHAGSLPGVYERDELAALRREWR